jgi:SMC proteins Flexible Hinge Domain.
VALEQIRDNIKKYTKEIEECSNATFEYLNQNSVIKSNIQRYETMLEQNAIRKAQLNQKILKSKSEEGLFDEEISRYRDQLSYISEEISRFTNESESLNKSVNDSQNKIDNITYRLNELQRQYHIEKSRHESLVNLTERYEGYGNSIKKVMEQKKAMPGIIGVVADIIKTKKEYETAIETALGQSIQNIITEDEKTAKDLIAYLKINKFGRATFLPLTNIRPAKNLHNHSVLSENGVIGIASSLVETENKFHELIEHLLGRIIVIDNIDNATKVARKYNYSLRIVTLEGELLSPGGSISGGAYKNTANLLGRRREIEALEELINKLDRQMADLVSEKEKETERKSDLMNCLDEIKKQLQEKYLEQNTVKLNLEQVISKKAEAEAVYRDYLKELSEIERQDAELKNNLDELNNSLSDNLLKNTEKEQRIEELNNLLAKERENESEIGEKASKYRMDLSALEQSNHFILENIKRIKREIEKLYDDEEAIKLDIQRISNIIQEKKETIRRTEEIINETNIILTQLDEKIKT